MSSLHSGRQHSNQPIGKKAAPSSEICLHLTLLPTVRAKRSPKGEEKKEKRGKTGQGSLLEGIVKNVAYLTKDTQG